MTLEAYLIVALWILGIIPSYIAMGDGDETLPHRFSSALIAMIWPFISAVVLLYGIYYLLARRLKLPMPTSILNIRERKMAEIPSGDLIFHPINSSVPIYYRFGNHLTRDENQQVLVQPEGLRVVNDKGEQVHFFKVGFIRANDGVWTAKVGVIVHTLDGALELPNRNNQNLTYDHKGTIQ